MGIRRRYCEICAVKTRQQDVPTSFGAIGLFGRGSNCDQCGHLNQSRIQFCSVVIDRAWRWSLAAALALLGGFFLCLTFSLLGHVFVGR